MHVWHAHHLAVSCTDNTKNRDKQFLNLKKVMQSSNIVTRYCFFLFLATIVLISVASQQLPTMHTIQILGVEQLQSAEKLGVNILLIDISLVIFKKFQNTRFFISKTFTSNAKAKIDKKSNKCSHVTRNFSGQGRFLKISALR